MWNVSAGSLRVLFATDQVIHLEVNGNSNNPWILSVAYVRPSAN